MFKTYDFRCGSCGHTQEELCRAGEETTACCRCGGVSQRVFTVTLATYVPPYHRAPGSVGSSYDAVERQAKYLKSDKHKKDMVQAEQHVERMRKAEDANQRLSEFVTKRMSEYDQGKPLPKESAA